MFRVRVVPDFAVTKYMTPVTVLLNTSPGCTASVFANTWVNGVPSTMPALAAPLTNW